MPDSCQVHLRDDLVAVSVLDAPEVTAVTAWPHSYSGALAGFIRTATRV